MTGAQDGVLFGAQEQTPISEHMFKRPLPYPQPQRAQVAEHLEYRYTLREYGLPRWPLRTTPHAMHPPAPPLPSEVAMSKEVIAELNQQETGRLQDPSLQQKIKIKQIIMLQRKIQRNTMEIESLQSQMQTIAMLVPEPPPVQPKMQPKMQPRSRPHPQLRKQLAFDLYRPYG